MEYKIGVIGLGYVGLPLAVGLSKFFNVTGFDVNQSRIDELKDGIDKTLEVDSSVLKSIDSITFTNDEEKLKHVNFYIVTVPTPVDSANRPDLSPLIKASNMIGKVLSQGDIVVYESTVYPGATEEVCVPALEIASKLTYNKDFFCGYSPERINPGDKVNTLFNTVKVTSGSTPQIADIVDKVYKTIITAGTWKVSSIKVAEASKVIENSQRDLNIAFVNELSVIFKLIGIDTIEVLEAAGTKWNFLPFRPGMVGGHCIGVDPYYLTHKAEQLGYHPQVILAGRRINDNVAKFAAVNIVKKMIAQGTILKGSVVAVLGVTFKENCPDIRNSKVFDLVEELESWGITVKLIDPWASSEDVMKVYSKKLTLIEELENLDGIIVSVAHTEFKVTPLSELRAKCSSQIIAPVLADLKSIYSLKDISDNNFSVFRL